MTIKTFSRARAAKAALIKLLTEDHEVPTAQFQITTTEPEPERYSAKVDFLVAQPPFVLMDLFEAGWEFTDPEAKMRNGFLSWEVPQEVKEAAILDLGMAGDATPYPAPAPTTQEEIKAKASGYVAEKSGVVGATKKVWEIADAMPGAKRKAVIEAARAKGVAYGTARTQYQKWFAAKKNS